MYHNTVIHWYANHIKMSCNRCGIAARQKCSRCGIQYCSKPCQILDWPQHKHKCTLTRRRHIEHAASLLQSIFVMFWQMTFGRDVIIIERTTNASAFEVGERSEEFFHELSSTLHTTGKERAMMACAYGCTASLAYFADLLNTMLQGTRLIT